ncbi:nitroreductase family protein [Larkinella soli]|uniref:nitroreductase family protein n=1 Tax=Larkinella soli TaxID=1770527 RepID=UPI000FFBDE8C|nr:nitroreductase family protein [Larkinella soli]
MTIDYSETKTAPTQHEVLDVIRNRWSPRSFADRPVAQEDLETLFEAASWAPSAINEQPWRYIYAHRSDTETFEKLLACLAPGNQVWARDAAVLVLSVARKTYSATGKPNRTHLYDTGAANLALLLQGTEMGIFGHQIGGFDLNKTVETVQLSDDFEPAVFIALGYRDSYEKLAEPFRTREMTPRSRKTVQEFTSEL